MVEWKGSSEEKLVSVHSQEKCFKKLEMGLKKYITLMSSNSV